jgi:hypothetical protein
MTPGSSTVRRTAPRISPILSAASGARPGHCSAFTLASRGPSSLRVHHGAAWPIRQRGRERAEAHHHTEPGALRNDSPSGSWTIIAASVPGIESKRYHSSHFVQTPNLGSHRSRARDYITTGSGRSRLRTFPLDRPRREARDARARERPPRQSACPHSC